MTKQRQMEVSLMTMMQEFTVAGVSWMEVTSDGSIRFIGSAVDANGRWLHPADDAEVAIDVGEIRWEPVQGLSPWVLDVLGEKYRFGSLRTAMDDAPNVYADRCDEIGAQFALLRKAKWVETNVPDDK